MVPTQTLENFPVFGNNATKVKPEEQKYSNGFMPADVYPSEWVNYVWNKASNGVTLLNAGVDMMEQEINNVLDGADKTPDATKNNQLLEAIQKLITDAETRAKLAAHPIGSLYWSKNSTDPSTLFGGTWARVKDKFILAAGDTYAQGSTGGAATVTLDTTKIPSHNHTFTGTAVTSGGSSAANTGSESSHTHSVGAHAHGLNSHTHSVTAAGTVSKHSHTMAHTHNVTAAGTVSISTNPTFTGTQGVTANDGQHTHYLVGFNNNISGSKYWWNGQTSGTSAHRIAVYNGSSSPTINKQTSVSGNSNVSKRIAVTANNWESTGNGTYDMRTDTSNSHYHSFTPQGTISGGSYSFSGSAVTSGASSAANTGETQPTFTGSAVTSGAASGNTANSAAFTSGAGSSHSHTMAHTHSVTASGTIGSTGGGGAHENMPPYVAYYCWERTA